IDLLIQRASPAARRLLWLATLASEPVIEELLAGVWSGITFEQERMQQIGEMLADVDRQPEGLRQWLMQLSPEVRAQCEAAHALPRSEPVGPLLAELRGAGLLSV